MCLNVDCALRSKSNPFLLFWSHILDLLADFGDAFIDFAASFPSIFEGIEFDDDIWYMADSAMEMRDFKRDTLNAHNNFRTLHGCPPLAMSEELSNTAQAWADKLADRGILQYSENPSVGENICLIDLDHLPSLKGEHVVKEWYKEIDNYNYNDPGWKKGSYRVSQLLWKSTSEIGIGIGKIPGQNRAYVVVNYRPAGNNNMPGEFERNVLPPQKRRDDNVPPWKKRP